MGSIFKTTHSFIDNIAPDTTIVEIGSERGEGSTEYFARLADEYKVDFHTIDILDKSRYKTNHNYKVCWHQRDGAAWSQFEYPKIRKKISVLYLDNFDWIYNHTTIHDPLWNEELYERIKGPSWPEKFDKFDLMPQWVQDESLTLLDVGRDEIYGGIAGRYKSVGFEFNNRICQKEHLTQLLFLYPFFCENTVVVFDDTFIHNGAWTGKCGPGAVFLESNGYQVVAQDQGGVIMKKTDCV